MSFKCGVIYKLCWCEFYQIWAKLVPEMVTEMTEMVTTDSHFCLMLLRTACKEPAVILSVNTRPIIAGAGICWQLWQCLICPMEWWAYTLSDAMCLLYKLMCINQSIICYGAPIRRSWAPNNNKKASIRWQDSARRQFQAGLIGDIGL